MTIKVDDPDQMSREESKNTAGAIVGLLGVGVALSIWHVVFRLSDDRYSDELGLLTILALLSSAIAILTVTQLERLAERGGVRLLRLRAWPCLIYLIICPVAIVASRSVVPDQDKADVLRILVGVGALVGLVGIFAGRRRKAPRLGAPAAEHAPTAA